MRIDKVVRVIKDCVEDKKEQQKVDKKKSSFAFLFFSRLKEDKKYLISFLTTLVFFGGIWVDQIRKSSGAIDRSHAALEEAKKNEQTVIVPITEEVKEEEKDEPDVSDYVGIYSKEVVLDNRIVISDTCQIDSYKYVYQVKKDGTINKYFYNSCVGAVLIWKDSISYQKYGGAQYIAANNMNFTFNHNAMQEVEGNTYEIDEDILAIKNKKVLDEAELFFYGDNVVFMTNTNLILIKKGKVSSPIGEEYRSSGGNLKKRFYKSEGISHQFNFIVFHNEESVSCYQNVSLEEENSPLYTIYSIRYDVNSNNFLDVKEVLTRSKSNSCEMYKEDLKSLEE